MRVCPLVIHTNEKTIKQKVCLLSLV